MTEPDPATRGNAVGRTLLGSMGARIVEVEAMPKRPTAGAAEGKNTGLIITIDGPAGTGKSTVARLLAKRLGVEFLDTGAMYRAAAAVAIDAGISLGAPDEIVARVASQDMHFDWRADPPELICGGRSMMKRIREPDVTRIVSPVASIPGLRRDLVRKQRAIARAHPRLVTEGRDQGSVVFPDADMKFYLDASAEVRARRRFEQLIAQGTIKGEAAELRSLLQEIVARDLSDSTRRDGPLICPEDAVRIDTSDMTLEQVVDELERRVRARVG
jgi:cytidylate kinase